MTARELHNATMELVEKFKTEKIDKYFSHLNKGDDRDIQYYTEIYRKYDHYPCYFYQYLASLIKIIQPKVVVEIGADRGASALCMASELPLDGKLYSIDIVDGWQYVPKDHPQIVKILGDSVLVTDKIPHSIDLMLIDGDHTDDTVRNEVKTYSPFWHKDTVVVFDDCRDTMRAVKELTYDTYFDTDNLIHGNSFALSII